jgi:restriction endonuclease S subunit
LKFAYEEIGIRSFGRGVFHKEPVSGLQLGSKRVFQIEPGDLLLSNVFAWEGAIAVADQTERGKIGSHRFMTYTPVDDRIDTNWACWFFRSEPGLELIRKASPGSAGRNRTLAIDRFELLEIPLPPIDEQRRIALRLDRIQTARDSVARLVQRASELSSAIVVSSAFRSDLTNDAKRSSRWTTRRLDELLELDIQEVTVDHSRSYEIAGVYSFGRGMFRRSTIDGGDTSYKSMYQLSAGQIVMSRLKAWEGAIALVPPELDGTCLSPEFPTFRVRGDVVEPAFIAAVLTSESFWSRLRNASKGIGARRERVSAARLLECEVDVPPLDIQRSIVRRGSALATANTRRAESSRLASALVPAALNAAFRPSS